MTNEKTYLDMEIDELKRLSEEDLEEDIISLIEDCRDMVATLRQETRNRIIVFRKRQEEDLVNEIAELRDSWDK